MKRAVSICTYNRWVNLEEIIEGVLSTVPDGTDVFVCDDGSTDGTESVVLADKFADRIKYYRGPNLGVAYNKNRALFLMQNHHFSAIIEDDLVPTEKGWFDIYEKVSALTDIHHFCRVQDKIVPECKPSFTEYLKKTLNVTPLYAHSPRGDLTFLTRKVITMVGGFSPEFEGAGYAHGSWSNRVARAELISHPNLWVDIEEARVMFKQVGDTEGGRFDDDPEEIKKQLKRNKVIAKQLKKTGEVYVPLQIT